MRPHSPSARCQTAALVVLLSAACAGSRIESTVTPGFDPSRYDRVAVTSAHGGISAGSRQAVVDRFQMRFLQAGWDVVESSEVDTAKAKLALQQSKLGGRDDRAARGAALGVPALVVVNLASDGENITVSAKLFDTTTSRLLWMSSGDARVHRGLAATTGAIAGAIVGSQVGSGSGAAIAGAVGGAMVGRDLAPKELQLVKQVVDDMFDDLPLRFS